MKKSVLLFAAFLFCAGAVDAAGVKRKTSLIQMTSQVAGGFVVTGGSVTIQNPYGLAVGTMLAVVQGSGNVGIGTQSPEGKLHVFSGSAGSFTPASPVDDLVIENNAAVGITLAAPDGQGAHIAFGEPAANLNTYIRGTSNNLQIYSNTIQTLYVSGSSVGINTDNTPASSAFDVRVGSISVGGNKSGLRVGTTNFNVSSMGTGNVGIGVSDGSSRLDVTGGSVTVGVGSLGIGGGVSAATYTVRGYAVAGTTWSTSVVRNLDGYVLRWTSGTIAANTTITISASQFLSGATGLDAPMCGEYEINAIATAGVKMINFIPGTSVGVRNGNAATTQGYWCSAWVRPP